MLAFEGCLSSDVFDYFCYWLIGNGRDAYETAMKDPDSIVDLMTKFGEPNFEELGSAINAGPEIAIRMN